MQAFVKNNWKFLGHKVSLLVILDLFLSVIWFGVESGFLLVFQGFLAVLQVTEANVFQLPEWYPRGLETNLLLFALYGFLRGILIAGKRIVPAMASEYFAAEQRIRILRKVFQHGQKNTTSEILSLYGDIATKAGYCVQHASIAISSFLIIILLLALSFRLAWIETLISVSLLLVIMLPLRFLNRSIRKEGEGVVKEWNHANRLLVNSLKNIFLLRLYNLIEVEFKNGINKIIRYERHYTRYLLSSGFVSGVPIFFGVLIITITAFVSKKYLTTNPFHFLAFLYLFLRTAQVASQLNTAFTNVVFFQQPFRHLFLWISDFTEGDEFKNMNISSCSVPESVSIEMSDVSFEYVPGVHVLQNLSFRIEGGEFLLIKGQSGAGKSTIIKLITGMENPQIGNVLVGNLRPSDFVSKYSSSIGYVGPEPLLIAGTVRENLLYGNLYTVSDDKIWECLDALGLTDVIKLFKGGLEEVLHEDTQLSTGQKQRLSFVRAILRAPIFLILDEATANIDYQTEVLIVNFLKSLKSKVTIVAISHRESFDQIADKRIRL